jgi:ArsR family transcriptional regulator
MGVTKTSLFTEKQNQMALMFKALGHPARIAIVEHLLKTDACISGEIVEEVQLAQATVSQHLKELREAGIIKGSIEGNAVCYCLDKSSISKLKKYFSRTLKKLEKLDDSCC